LGILYPPLLGTLGTLDRIMSARIWAIVAAVFLTVMFAPVAWIWATTPSSRARCKRLKVLEPAPR
jgi:hypothetical protein